MRIGAAHPPRTVVRGGRRRILALVAAAAVGLPAAVVVTPADVASAATDGDRGVEELRDDLSATDAELDSTRRELDDTGRRIERVTAEVRESAALVLQYEAELVSLEQQLADAEEAARTARRRVERARIELLVVDTRLRRSEDDLAARERVLHDRAVSAFMYGEANVADAVVGSQSLADFVSASYYLETVLLADIDAIDELDRLRERLAADRVEADALSERVQVEQLAADAARLHLEDLTAAQRRITATAIEERARRARLLTELEVHEAATRAQLVQLEEESAALAEQLREAQWQAGAAGNGPWVWPTSGTVGSPFGYRTHPIYGGLRLHAGVDIAGPFGQPIVAANTGLVVTASCSSSGYGCLVVIDHGGGLATLYAHQSSFAVTEGEVVVAGDVIGSIGSTGASTGPHLHFEVRRNGVPEDPMPFIAG